MTETFILDYTIPNDIFFTICISYLNDKNQSRKIIEIIVRYLFVLT